MMHDADKKRFDCIEFKQRSQAEIYEKIGRLGPSEQIAFLEKNAEQGTLGDWWKSIKVSSEARLAKRLEGSET